MIFDILTILEILSSRKKKSEKTDFLKDELRKQPIRGKLNVVWRDTYNQARDLELFQEQFLQKTRYTTMTKKGESFHSMETNGRKLGKEQQEFIFSRCIIGNKKFPAINSFLDDCQINDNQVFQFPSDELGSNEPLSLSDQGVLNELDVIVVDKTTNTTGIRQQYSENIDQAQRGNIGEQSQDEVDAALKDMKAVGNKAEKASIKYERNNLLNRKLLEQVKMFDDLNSKEKLIAKKNVNAGYDISSFRNKTSDKSDKYIEVKGRKKKKNSFIISRNELRKGEQTSKEKDKEFVIYFWDNIDSKPTEPRIIPFKDLHVKPCKNCLSYIIKQADSLGYLGSSYHSTERLWSQTRGSSG